MNLVSDAADIHKELQPILVETRREHRVSPKLLKLRAARSG
ncbi:MULTISPECIES: hypothetical protein [Myxococcus]|nr:MULTISPECIES: hypothetical protein [Myxococcus]